MGSKNRYSEVFKQLEEEVVRIHENEDCSELAEKGLQLVHRSLPNEGIIVRLEPKHIRDQVKVPFNSKLGYGTFDYHEFLLIGRHVFDPDTAEKLFPALKYVEELQKLNRDLSHLKSNRKCFNRLLTKGFYKELRRNKNILIKVLYFG